MKYKESEKSYKKLLDNELKRYRNNLSKNLKEMRTKNPKEYWKIVNKNRYSKQDSKQSIDINTLYEYFKDLNKAPEINEDVNEMLENELSSLEITSINDDLNEPISEDEIIKCIKNLKNNKSCGDDNIKNEYIKSTANLLLPLYVKLDVGTLSPSKIDYMYVENVI